ncbi:MAG: hypothetical protein GXO23_03840 [Crenarchaeota archaeon]|nr:hypothetical protein [Thermoproteota archaeon]
MRDLIAEIEEQEIRPENGAVIIYIGVVKGLKEGRKIEKIHVRHNTEKIEKEIYEKFKEDIEKNNIKIKLKDGDLRPGEPITIIQIQSEDRYSATMKLLKIIDIVKRNTIIEEHYTD